MRQGRQTGEQLARKKDDRQPIAPPADDADTYALNREEPNERRGGGWTVAIRRRGKKIVRLFKDSIYGSSDAAYAQARAYRDAIITALPPPTNLEQAVKIRKNNKSGISGVRRVETEEGDVWQATLMTNEGQKRESFSIGRLGEEAAKSMAIAQRMRWLKALPVKHLAYAHHAEEITRLNFDHQLDVVADVAPQVQISEGEVVARIAEVNARFDAYRPPRLKVRVKSYGPARLAVAVSDGGSPAKRKLAHVNTAKMMHGGALAAAGRVREVVEEIYNADVARWFVSEHGNALLASDCFDPAIGFNVTVWVPVELIR
ncbi:hypothetical protein [Endobacterium cereale]|uniref:hypothetical protein n=1 Tax=Endobacterium cereale TaxID=2663029 RepID=UPI001F31E2C5|nr:hypothetical protein [Endobacterium cereale]MEB2848211.1 hypothetical protein [Endobacterium cereale]